jgi:7-cyano-7-deazaguanine synthase
MTNFFAKKKGVILLSGGVDSATTLYIAKKKGFSLTAVIFNYHQGHKKEIECAKKIARLNKVPYKVIVITLPWAKSSLTRKSMAVPLNRKLSDKAIPSTYVSGRNIIFLSYAVSLAESIKADSVFIGAHVEDYSGYPDCRPEFIKAFEKAAKLGVKNSSIKVIAPLLNKNKKEIIRLGIALGVPYEFTWSCYKGADRPCCECDSCRYRMNAFTALRLKDPGLK